MDRAGGDGGEPGVWVPLRVLRQLDLPPAAHHRLIAALRAETAGQLPEDPLLAELTELGAAALREALESLWTADGEAELAKIPFFVRGKVRKNTEAFARERGLERIDAEALYDAKAHFSR